MSGKLLLEGVAVGLGVESFKVFISTHFDYMKTAFLNIKIQLIGSVADPDQGYQGLSTGQIFHP